MNETFCFMTWRWLENHEHSPSKLKILVVPCPSCISDKLISVYLSYIADFLNYNWLYEVIPWSQWLLFDGAGEGTLVGEVLLQDSTNRLSRSLMVGEAFEHLPECFQWCSCLSMFVHVCPLCILENSEHHLFQQPGGPRLTQLPLQDL